MVVADSVNDVGDHLFEFGDEGLCIILLLFNFTKFLLPDTCEFSTLEEFFVDDADEFHTCRSGNEAFAFLADVVTFEKGFDDGGTGGRTPDAVFLHGIAQFFVIDKLACRFHRTEQGGFGIGFGRLCPFLGKRGEVRTRLKPPPSLPQGGGVAIRRVFVGRVCYVFVDDLPTLVKNHPSAGTEQHPGWLSLPLGGVGGGLNYLPIYRRGFKLAVGIEDGDEGASDKVIDAALHVGETDGWHTCGDDGMVVSYFGRVKDFLRLGERLSFKGLGELFIAFQTSECLRAFGIDIVAEEGGINTRIGGELLLVETLDELQGLFGRIAKFAVAIHLQGSQIIESRRGFGSFLLLNVCNCKRLPLNGLEHSPTLFFCQKLHLLVDGSLALEGLALFGSRFHFGSIFCFRLFIVGDGGEFGVAIEGGEHPTLLGHETLYLLLATHDECQCRGLHTSDGEHLFLLSIFERIEACGIYAECPVTDGATKSCFVE